MPSPDSGRDDVKGNVSELPMPEGTVSPFYRRTLVYYCKVATELRQTLLCVNRYNEKKQTARDAKQKPSLGGRINSMRHPVSVRNRLEGS